MFYPIWMLADSGFPWGIVPRMIHRD